MSYVVVSGKLPTPDWPNGSSSTGNVALWQYPDTNGLRGLPR